MAVDVRLRALPVLSYAMSHNRIPVIDQVELVATRDAPGAVLHLQIDDDEGPITHDYRQIVDLVAGETIRVERPLVRPDPARLLQVRARRPGWILAELMHNDSLLGRARAEIELLPGVHWLNAPAGLAPGLLAAHVLPNDPAIATLLHEAAAILRSSTGDPSLEGYQSGPERVDAIVGAIWAATQARRIHYALPPDSWSKTGQQVRTPAEVLDGGAATCLDTTVVLAAALERSGIRPLLWLLDGHAFLAYWRFEQALDAVSYDDPAEIMNEVDRDRMRLVETTVVCESPQPTAIAEAHQLAHRRIADLSVVQAIVDVWTARQFDILPLPVRREQDGVVQVIEYQAGNVDRQIVIGGSATTPEAAAPDPTPPRIQRWKNSLLDLSLRNRLINYTERSGIRLYTSPDQLGTLEDFVSGGQAITLRPADSIEPVDAERGVRDARDLSPQRLAAALLEKKSLFTDVPAATYLTKLRGLAHKARTIEEESGANNLYLALGSLSWSLDGKPLRSPLILVPVRLITAARTQQAYRLQLDESGASTPNFCLLEKLRSVLGLTIPKLADPDLDHSGIDLDGTLAATRDAIAARGLAFRVEPTADLAILQFAKFRLWKDLDEHWESTLQNPLVRHLVETPTRPFDDPVPAPTEIDFDGLDATCPVAADASQLTAVAEAVTGRTFVLEGPPGTGKSQTITNLLTRAVADGKRVLFVAEKRAALDVVASRLASVGMGPFALDLHDKGAKPAVVRAQVKRAMDHLVEVDTQGLAAAQDDLDASRRSLGRYATRLHDANPAGLSYYSARTQLLALGCDGPFLTVPTSVWQDPTRLVSLRRCLKALPDSADLARPSPDHPWGMVSTTESSDIDDPSSAAARTHHQLLAAGRVFDGALELLPAAGLLADVVAEVRSADDFACLGALAGAPTPLPILDAASSPQWREAAANVRRDLDRFIAASNAVLVAVTPDALGLPLAEIAAASQAAEDANFLVRGKRRKAVAERLTSVLRPGATVDPESVPQLLAALIATEKDLDSLTGRIAALHGVQVPTGWSPFSADGPAVIHRQIDWLTWASGSTSASNTGPFVTAVRQWLATQPSADGQASAACRAAGEALLNLLTTSGLSDAGLTRWLGASGFVGRWKATSASRDLSAGAAGLRRWLAFQSDLVPLRVAGMDDAADALAIGSISADDAAGAFERGLAYTSMRERRSSTGLEAFDPLAHDRTVTRFTQSASTVREQMACAVPAEVLSARDFRADSQRGAVGELRREISRQRGGLGVRALMLKHGNLITRLMPCVLVSPDSVSRFFPIGSQMFDLVVFDEASQIRVADAIGAMGRARSVVVVGDSKQMPPSSFAEAGVGDEDSENADADIVEDQESILTEVLDAGVPQRWLTWHYRSRDETLIAFSNAHYYENKLSSFPAPTHETRDRLADGYGLSLIRVNGAFQRSGKGKLLRTNPVEAEAIFDAIRARFDSSPDVLPSIGVVTFNQQQRAYIEALIRDSGHERMIAALDGRNGEGLFVKNLENVQGDERDVILFSTAFSVNERGVLPLNFGPLTRAGGERRLNVAITRARRQVVIYSSFDPGQMRVEESQSQGIRHLRDYLELAAKGTGVAGGAVRPKPIGDRHRDEVAAALRARGVVVATDVGLSDFRIDITLAAQSAPDSPLVAVLLDGPGWASRRTVGDRDGLPISVLRGLMRWPAVERVWMPAWQADPEGVVSRLLQSLGEAESAARLAAESATSDSYAEATVDLFEDLPEFVDAADGASVFGGRAPSAPDPVATPEPRETPPPANDSPAPAPPVSAGEKLAGEEPYRACVVRQAGTRDVLDNLPSPAATAQVRAVLSEIVAAEGPIHTGRLAKLVAAAFDLTRVRQDRVEAILRALPASLTRDPDDPFVWPASIDPAAWLGFRTVDDTEQRDLDEVSLIEIGNAMASLCADCGGMAAAEMSTEALALFGGRRKTAGITARLDAARDLAVKRGALQASDGTFTAAPRSAPPAGSDQVSLRVTATPSAPAPPLTTSTAGGLHPLATAVIGSAAFVRQRQITGRVGVTDMAVEVLLSALLCDPSRRLTLAAAGTALGVGPGQGRGAVIHVQRLLNVDGYFVLHLDADAGSVILEEALLREQFEIT